MAQKPYQEDGDKPEDYELRDEHEDIDYEYSDDDNGKRRFKWRRLLILLIIILAAAWFIYHQYEHRKAQQIEASSKAVTIPPKVVLSSKTEKTTSTEISGAEHAKTIREQREKQAAARAKAAVEARKQAATSEAKMSTIIQNNRTQLTQLQSQVSRIERRVSVLVPEERQTSVRLTQLNRSMQANQQLVSGQLNAVAQKLNQLSGQLQRIEAAREKEMMVRMTAEARKQAAIRHRLNYYVQAVVPGRAWLKSANGDTETVAVGDIIDGYGKTLAIDPYSGDVVTSSGVMIRYGVGT